MNKYEKKHCEAFGQYLKENRKNAGLTQNDVSEACGFSNAQFISNIERGTCWPPMNVLSVMAKLYKVSHHDFLDKFADARKEIWASEMGLRKSIS
jgi:transcriptional regulator with XRE-family HTH domain